MRIASWNLHQRAGDAAARLGSVLADLGGADIVLLQESSQNGLNRFVKAAGLDWGVHLRDHFFDLLRVRGRAGRTSVDDGERFPNGRCVAIAGRGEPLRNPCAFPDSPVPEKVMAGWVDIDGVRTTVVTYHAPNGEDYGVAKVRQAVRVADWLATLDGPVVLGGDFNTPLVDPIDVAGVRTHMHSGNSDLGGEPGDDLLVGPAPVHGLRDALRTHLATRPERVEAILSERPEGPLEVSYRTSDSDEGRFRFDAIWLSPHFAVNSVEYHYDAAIAAGTDHALVIADIELADRGS
jgi:endonuclease/exonuclease/phosphatase family metal-dependent hydrolase